jgi:hypothetical protein
MSARRLNQNRISLPDVDERNPQIVARRSRRPQHESRRRRNKHESADIELHCSVSRQDHDQQV